MTNNIYSSNTMKDMDKFINSMVLADDYEQEPANIECGVANVHNSSKKMTLDDLALLVNEMVYADDYAQSFANVEDGGTCNFDTPMVKLNISKKLLDESYFNVTKWGKRDKTDGKTWFVLNDVKLDGQGYRRTKMAEAFAKKLAEFGWQTGVYYQMD